jgi:4-hydroxy-3-methylbut-2-en-1-yl diphosphate reductase
VLETVADRPLAPPPSARHEGLLVAAPMALEQRLIRSSAPVLDVRRTGMGRRRSEAAGAALGSAQPVPLLVIMGFAGGLGPDARAGQVLVADEIRGTAGELVACDAADLLASALTRAGVEVRRGVVASAARPVLGAARARMHERLGAVAADMESLWLARAANAQRLAVVRVLADAPAAGIWRPWRGVHSLLAARDALRRAAEAVGALASDHEPWGVGML